MRKFNKRLLLILTGLLGIMLLLVACDKKNPPADTTPETDNEVVTTAPSIDVTEAPTDEATLPEETDAPEPETMSSDEITLAFANALAATDEKTAYKNVMSMSMSMMGMDMGSMKSTEIVDGENRVFIEEAVGVSSTTIFIDDKVYMASTYENQSELYVITLTEEQLAWVMSMYATESGDSSMDMAVDQFVGLEGTKYPDGSIVLTATGLSEELISSMLGDMEDAEMVDLELNIKSCKLTINAAGLMESLTLDLDMNGKVEQDGISVEITASMKCSMTAEYENISVTEPENAENYVADTFEHFFMFTPSEEEAEAAGLPLDQDSYTIGAEDSQFSADDQYFMLTMYPTAYEGKTFVIYGTVSEDEELGTYMINAGEYGSFYYYCPDGVTPPVYGDTVKITATFEKTVDKGYDSDYFCYTLMVSECDVLAHVLGPNGGRIMYITASALNVRTSSDTSSSDNILGTLSKGDAVEVFDQDEKGWWRIEFNGQTAYISNTYVSETKPD